MNEQTRLFITLILAIGTISLNGYTHKFQNATLSIGRKLSPSNELMPNGFQDAITPKLQTTRNILVWVMLLVLCVYSFVFYKWYAVLGILAGVYVCTGILMSILNYYPRYFYNKINNDLLKRRAEYESNNDKARVIIIDTVVDRMRSIDPEKIFR